VSSIVPKTMISVPVKLDDKEMWWSDKSATSRCAFAGTDKSAKASKAKMCVLARVNG